MTQTHATDTGARPAAPPPALTAHNFPRSTVAERIVVWQGDTISIKRSQDGAHLFLQVANDLESCLVALPTGAAPWVVRALADFMERQQ